MKIMKQICFPAKGTSLIGCVQYMISWKYCARNFLRMFHSFCRRHQLRILSILFGSWTWRNFRSQNNKFTYFNPNTAHTDRSIDKFTITELVDFPLDTEHSTSTFRSIWSFPPVFSNNSSKLDDFFKLYRDTNFI